MSYENRDLIRKPLCMLRPTAEQREKLIRFAMRRSNGGAVAPTLLDALMEAVELAEMDEAGGSRLHAANASQKDRIDMGPFAALRMA